MQKEYVCKNKISLNLKFTVVCALSLVLFTANIGGLSIYILDEAKNSTAAREMFDRGDLIVPTFNYELRTDKPPLHYFFMMTAYGIFGVNEFSARFFSALFGILTVLSTYFFTRKFINEDAAFWSAIVLLSSIQVITQFHLAVPDPYLIFFFTTALFLGYTFYLDRKLHWIYLAYVCIAFAILSKGPVAMVLSGAVLFLFLLWKKELNYKTIAVFRPLQGILIILLITLPWFIAVHLMTDGEWTSGFFLKHNLGRFTSTMEGHGGSFFLIPFYVICGLFPFSIFIVHAILFFFKNRDKDFLVFGVIVSLVVIVFFSFSGTKLPNYPAPAFPFVAILLGFFLSEFGFSILKYKIIISYGVYLVISIALPIAIYIVLEDLMLFPDLKNLAFWFLLIPLGSLLSIAFFLRGQVRQSFISIAASWVFTTLIFYYIVFPSVDSRNPVYQALKILDTKTPVFYYGKYNPSFSFYIRKPIKSIDDPLENETGEQKVFLLSMKKKVSDLEFLKPKYQIILESKEFFEPYYSVLLYADPQSFPIKGKLAKH